MASFLEDPTSSSPCTDRESWRHYWKMWRRSTADSSLGVWKELSSGVGMILHEQALRTLLWPEAVHRSLGVEGSVVPMRFPSVSAAFGGLVEWTLWVVSLVCTGVLSDGELRPWLRAHWISFKRVTWVAAIGTRNKASFPTLLWCIRNLWIDSCSWSLVFSIPTFNLLKEIDWGLFQKYIFLMRTVIKFHIIKFGRLALLIEIQLLRRGIFKPCS